MTLDSIATVTISTNTVNPSRAGFGTPGLLAYFPTSVFAERVRSYSSLVEMTDDGHLTSDAAYLMAVALKASNPSVQTWKVCRKALPSQQSLRVTPTITTAGEVLSFNLQGTAISYTILAGATVATIVTALTALCAAVTGVTASDDTTHMTLTPKNVASATVTVDGVANNEDYTITLDGVDFTFTSDGTATATEIRDGLQALIIAGGYAASEVVDNAADALDFAFASHAGADLRESTSGGGATMAISAEVSARRLLALGAASTGISFQDMTADPGIATDWAAIIAEDSDFYGVGLDSESEAEILALAALVETQRMIFVASNFDTQNTAAGTTTDVASDLEAAAYDRTVFIQSNYNSQYSGVRWMGKMLPKDPGSATWAYKTLTGVTVSAFTAAQLTGLNGKTANHYTTVGGVNITQKGYAASGEFVDITRGVDWFKVRLQERIYRLLVNNDKIAYEDAGALAYAEILAQLEEGEKQNVIAPNTEDTPWAITVPDVGDISATNKGNRVFPDVEFSAYLSGAVHTFTIQGTLSL
jgi:hypothetical protein